MRFWYSLHCRITKESDEHVPKQKLTSACAAHIHKEWMKLVLVEEA